MKMKLSDIFGIDEDQFTKILEIVKSDIGTYNGRNVSKVISMYLAGAGSDQKIQMLRFCLLGRMIEENQKLIAHDYKNHLAQLQLAIEMLADLVRTQKRIEVMP